MATIAGPRAPGERRRASAMTFSTDLESLAMLRNVLILSASAGAGHLRAAQALERVILDLKAAQAVRHVDTLEYTNPLFRRLYSKAYIEMVNRMPEVLGWLYDHLDDPERDDR